MILRRKIQLGAFVIFVHALVLSVLGKKFHGCQTKSPQGYYICNQNNNGIFQESCNTYAVLRANSDAYSSLSNLSYLLNISPSVISQANGGFSSAGPTAAVGQPILIPINCNCNTDKNGGFFEAQVTRTTVEGESFEDIARSFEGLTTCQGIHRRNPSISLAKNLNGGIGLSIPLKCACSSSSISSDEFNMNLVSYPVKQGDTLSQLAFQFNVTTQAIVSANNRHSKLGFNLINNATLLIPVQGKPNIMGFFSPKPQPQNPSFRQPPPTIQPQISHKKKTHKNNFGVVAFIVFVILIIGTSIFSAIVYFCIKYWKKKRNDLINKENWDQLKGLSLSVRTSTDKKLEDPNMLMGNFLYEDLQMATGNFCSSNLIEGSVFHGRLNGKNMAIKRTPSHSVSRIDFRLFDEMIHQNIIRVLGTCMMDGPDSFVVFEYAENGSLKDWIHGGLAIKSQFISSCNCFLKFRQRLKICLDVATALYYMHFITKPGYVHRNIRSRNIFLDENFNAKLGNFGMANCVEHVYEDQESCNKGYLAPEYVAEGVISPTIDVFAYGVVLLEVLSGKPAVRRGEGSLVKLCDEINRVLQSEEELKAWLDSAFLEEEYSFEKGVVVAKLAGACVEEEPSLRPGAGEIVDQLLRLVEELPEDDRFGFFK
ncbi:hypothetical protein ABFS83_06G008300 [Erythranthe nasuta]